jgi:hypothetical protein
MFGFSTEEWQELAIGLAREYLDWFFWQFSQKDSTSFTMRGTIENSGQYATISCAGWNGEYGSYTVAIFIPTTDGQTYLMCSGYAENLTSAIGMAMQEYSVAIHQPAVVR